MGMFDDIRCEMILPTPEGIPSSLPDVWFQTKSLDCLAKYYKINDVGYLLERNLGNDGEWYNGDWFLLNQFNGELRFYSMVSSIFEPNNPRVYGGWIEFLALLVGGRVVSLTLEKYKPWKA